MAEPPKPRWGGAELFWTEEGLKQDREAREKAGQEIIKHGIGLHDEWTGLAYHKPPEDILGRILWTGGVLGQLVISLFTFPAALGCFLLEEAVQSYGMGAYILYSSRYYDLLDNYLEGYQEFVEGADISAISLATISPITGGAVIQYMSAAKSSYLAFRTLTDRKLLEMIAEEAQIGEKVDWLATHGILRLQSSPSSAQIFMNGEDTELVTPETFKDLDAGTYTFLLKKYSVVRDVEETLEFTINIEAGRRKEIFARIPKIIDGVKEPEETHGLSDEPQLPLWIKAEVTGEYAIDGDTFITTTGERIRVLAIDAPEIGRPWADVSKESLGLNIEDKKISLRIQSHKPLGPHGRTLAICSNYKGDIAVFQLSSGLARVAEFEDDRFDYRKYYSAEQVAKDRGIGIWS